MLLQAGCCSAAERGTGSPAPPDVCPLHTDHLSADPPAAAELLVLQHVSLTTQGPDLDIVSLYNFTLSIHYTASQHDTLL